MYMTFQELAVLLSGCGIHFERMRTITKLSFRIIGSLANI
jgi:hypothetical protein